MIPLSLLTKTEGRAIGALSYGGPGLNKTLAIHTLPPKILMLDFEGGTAPLLPWIDTRTDWDQARKITYTQEQREEAFKAVNSDLLKRFYGELPMIKPGPLIDVIWFDPRQWDSYTAMVGTVGSIDREKYSSVCIDSLQEFSSDVQTFSKGSQNRANSMTMSEAGAWAGAQERTRMVLQDLRAMRDRGMVIYLTCSETIDKDYVTDPRSQARGVKEEPYSIKGGPNVPGQMANYVQHVTDLQFHAKFIGGKPMWISEPDPIGAGGANWEAKDRYGRLEKYCFPNFRWIFDKLYGQELRKEIYKR